MIAAGRLRARPGILLNINFPDCRPDEVAGVEVTRQGKRDQSLLIVEERIDTCAAVPITGSASSATAPRRPGTDLRAIYDRRISITPLHMNMTQLEAIDVLRTELES